MNRFVTLVLYLILISATTVAVIYFSNISFTYSTNFFSTLNSSTFYTYSSKSPPPLVKFWHRNNSTDKLCVWFNFIKAIKISSNSSISLCTHGSIGYSKFIFDHAKYWSDLISVSLLLDSNGFYALRAFQKLHHCIPEATEKISAHLVWRAETTCSATFVIQGLSNLSPDPDPQNCNLEDDIEKGLFDHSLSLPYPPNSMRNIARKGAGTRLHLIADIENHFSLNSSEILSLVAAKNVNANDKLAVIVRRFEYNDTYSDPPRTIDELWDLIDNEHAFEFHHFLYAPGHAIPGLNEWLNYSMTVKPILTPVTYQGNAWEPQLVVDETYPYHFEGFPVKFHDQQALPYELCRAGYSFAVASGVFSFHKGIKKFRSTKELAARESITALAKETDEKFRNYIDKNYFKFGILTNCNEWE